VIGQHLAHDQSHPSDVLPRDARAWIEIAGCALFLTPWLVLLLWSSLPFVRLSWRVLEPSAQPGGLQGLYLVKSLLPLFAVLMLLQALAVIGRKTLFLAGRSDLLPPAAGAAG